ncbi:thiol reductant ABC exporter subunit CydD [Aureimonas mangrovi]|uniref:thiol reductant ABC exporter subunit CydD n=1 Tax=Aureimonas mangrovi TaxID=2758041 RepID=UPI00163DCA38|nr:thiol reductant ABC exporter subunit CydD [Aureimonas mangrovi]
MSGRVGQSREEARRQRRFLKGLRRDGGAPLLVALVLPLLSGGLLVAQAGVLATVLNAVIAEGTALAELSRLLFLLAGLVAARAVLAFAGERAGIGAAERIKEHLRARLFARMLAHNPDWTASRSSGALSSAMVDQTEALDGFFARFLPAAVQAAFLPIAFAAAVMPVDVVVGLLFLLTAPMIPLFMALVGWGAEGAANAQARALSRLSGYFADRLRGLSTLKLFGRAEAEAEAMRTTGEELRARTMRVLRIAFLSSAVLEFFAALGVAGVALYVGLSYLEMIDLRFGSELTLTAGLFCLLMAPEVYHPLRLMAAHYHDRAGAMSAAAEIEAAFGEETPFPHTPSAVRTLPAGALAVEVHGLALETPGGRRSILRDSDLNLRTGEHVALLGASGSGKTTLLEACAALRSLAGGEIRIGGAALGDIPEDELRERVALIGQRPRLFHGTIAENIALGLPHASEQAVSEAARAALVTDFADQLPLGLHTPVGEGGFGLSGGEGHRIGLARLYLRDPSVILLDEPTAHLDGENEQLVLDALLRFARGRTLLVATHSAALATRMDRTVRLSAGRLLVPANAASTAAATEDAA